MVEGAHSLGGIVVIISTGSAGVWALLAHYCKPLRCRLGIGALVVAHVLVLLQTLSGVWLQVEASAVGGQHQLYGFTAFLSVGIIFAYRHEMRDRVYLLYGLGTLWLMGLAIRAIFLV